MPSNCCNTCDAEREFADLQERYDALLLENTVLRKAVEENFGQSYLDVLQERDVLLERVKHHHEVEPEDDCLRKCLPLIAKMDWRKRENTLPTMLA